MGIIIYAKKIEISENRLNIKEDSFLLELDSYYDESNKFKTSIKKLPVNIKHPKSLSSEEQKYIQSFIDSTESFLYEQKKTETLLKKYIDIQSFALFWIIHELTLNSEPRLPKSVYMYKEKNSPFKLGPVWDFDWDTFTSKKSGLLLKNSLWFDQLRTDTEFKNLIKDEWNNNKSKFKNLLTHIDSLAAYIEKSNEYNSTLWPMNLADEQQFLEDETLDFNNAIEKMKRTYSKRIHELDTLLSKL